MMSLLKSKVGSVLARAYAIGARRALADVSNRIDTFARLSVEQTEFTREIATASRRDQAEMRHQLGRIDTFARLTAEQTEFTREIAAASRRDQAEVRHRLDEIDRALTSLREQSSRYVFLGGTLGLASVDHGHRLFVDTRDRQLTPHLVTNGVWEEWNARLFRQVLRAGDLVVDGGSNVGYFVTLAAGLVGRSGHVYAFEANPDIARLLTATVEINGFASGVTVSPVAISDIEGVARFIAYPDRQGDGTLLEHDPDADLACGSVVDVPTGRLDALLPPKSSIRLMHLDIEGAEPAALRGAHRVIEDSPRLVLLVEWGRRGADVTELRWLIEKGFNLWIMRHGEPPKPIEVAELTTTGLCDLLLHRGTLADLGYGPR